MLVRGIRGATTVSQNTKEDIVKETSTLLSEMISANAVSYTHLTLPTTPYV